MLIVYRNVCPIILNTKFGSSGANGNLIKISFYIMWDKGINRNLVSVILTLNIFCMELQKNNIQTALGKILA